MMICCIEFREEHYHKKVSNINVTSITFFISVITASYGAHSVPSHHFVPGPNPPLREQHKFSGGIAMYR